MATRRDIVKTAGFGLIAAEVAGVAAWLPPAEARGRGATLKALTRAEATTLEALGDTLLPGAAREGVAHFVDHHLSVPDADSLLMLRYFDWPPPYLPFYRGGLAALDALAGGSFAALKPAARGALVGRLMGPLPEWRGPPAMLFYLSARADAVDVVYGTEAGTERLGLPYQAHIAPPRRW